MRRNESTITIENGMESAELQHLLAWLCWRDRQDLKADQRYRLALESRTSTHADSARASHDTKPLPPSPAQPQADQQYPRELSWLECPEHHLLSCLDPNYPQALHHIADPPAVLMAQGRLELLQQNCIAVVGSRRAQPWALDFTRKLAAELAANHLCVVSGMACGVDAAAHQGALERGSSIAVMATGMDIVYPRSNRGLHRKLCEQGLVLSEFAYGTPPMRHHFPQRNRIISGLCRAIVVVQAAERSGSLITARLAAEQGRDVMAVPGAVFDSHSRGCNMLIRQGAKLIESAQDVLDELGLESSAAPALTPASNPADAQGMSTDSQQALKWLSHAPVSIEALVQRCDWTHARMATAVLELELCGLATFHPGQGYTRR